MKLHESWKPYLADEFEKPYMKSLLDFLDQEKRSGKIIYPAPENIFAAFEHTPFDQVKVVILGQDPYHGQGQAHGLSFSVLPDVRIPPSLVNIYKELQSDLSVVSPKQGTLVNWAKQGVLLLNAVLTVEQNKAGSHHKKGWEQFTDKVIEVLNREKKNLVFILWGAPAQKKAAHVDEKKHLLIKSVHPSPLSSYRGFFGSKPFSKTNQYLREHHISEINWA
jgi:uracil-DNA glycosylase